MEKDHSENRVEYTQASGNGRVPIYGNSVQEYDIVWSIQKYIEGQMQRIYSQHIRKGPNSQGGSSGKTIATCQRGIDPSFVGRIDLNVVGNSDPGSTGILTPFIETYGLNISDKKEPETKQFELMQIIEEAIKNEYDYIEKFGIESYDEYYDVINNIYNTTTGCSITTRKE